MTLHFTIEPVPLSYDKDGVIRVGNTRVSLDTVVEAFQAGATVEEIVQQYPTLQLSDVYHVIGYYLRQSVEVEEYLRHRKKRSDEIRKQNESRFSPLGVRERLMSRRSPASSV